MLGTGSRARGLMGESTAREITRFNDDVADTHPSVGER